MIISIRNASFFKILGKVKKHNGKNIMHADILLFKSSIPNIVLLTKKSKQTLERIIYRYICQKYFIRNETFRF